MDMPSGQMNRVVARRDDRFATIKREFKLSFQDLEEFVMILMPVAWDCKYICFGSAVVGGFGPMVIY